MNVLKSRKPYPIKLVTADDYGYDKMQQLINEYRHSNWLRRLEIIDELRNIDHPHARDCIRSAAIHDEATIIRSIATQYAHTLKIEKNGHPITLYAMKAIFRIISQKNLIHNLNQAKMWLEKHGVDLTASSLISQYKKMNPTQYDFLYGRKVTEEETAAFIVKFAMSNGIIPTRPAKKKAIDNVTD